MDNTTLNILSFLFGAGVITGIIGFIMKIGGYSANIKNIKDDVSEIKGDCKNIWDSISKHGADIKGLMVHTKYGFSNSPTQPNDLGKNLLEKSGFNEVYPKVKNEIFALMDSYNLRTLYDYEKEAETALKAIQNNPVMDKIKNHSVNHPSEPLELIFRVASWIIRDDYDKYKKGQ